MPLFAKKELKKNLKNNYNNPVYLAHEIICYRLTHAFCQTFPPRLSLTYVHITNLIHIPRKKKPLLYSTYILMYYYFKPISTPRFVP